MKNKLIFAFIVTSLPFFANAQLTPAPTTPSKSPATKKAPVKTVPAKAAPVKAESVNKDESEDQQTSQDIPVKTPSIATKGNAKAIENPADASVLKINQKPPVPGVFGGFISGSYSTNLYDFNDGTRKDGFDTLMSLSEHINADYSLNGRLIYSADLKDSTNNDFSDTTFTLGHAPMQTFSLSKMSWSVGAVAPTSKESRILTNLQTQLRTAVTFIPNAEILWKGLSVSLGFGFAKGFHTYETSSIGKVNTSWVITQVLDLRYAATDKLTLSLNGTHISKISYQNVVRESFESSQDITYAITDHLSASVGHSNSGSTLAANGVDSNVRLFDENNSTVYAALTAGF